MKKTLALLLSALLLVGLLAGCGGGGNTPEDVATQYMKATLDAKGGKTLIGLMPDAFADAGVKAGVYDSRDEFIQAINDLLAPTVEGLEETYGKYKVQVEVNGVEKWNEEDVEDYNHYYQAMWQLDLGVEDGADVALTVTIDGEKGSDTEETTVSVIQVDGKWCIMGADI